MQIHTPSLYPHLSSAVGCKRACWCFSLIYANPILQFSHNGVLLSLFGSFTPLPALRLLGLHLKTALAHYLFSAKKKKKKSQALFPPLPTVFCRNTQNVQPSAMNPAFWRSSSQLSNYSHISTIYIHCGIKVKLITSKVKALQQNPKIFLYILKELFKNNALKAKMKQ